MDEFDHNAEDRELDQAFDQLRSENNTKKSRKTARTVLTAVAVVLLAAIIAGTCWFLSYTADDGLIYPNVYAMDIDLGGMTQEEATAVLSTAFDGIYAEADLTVELPDATVVLSHDGVAPTLDLDALVADAYNYGRTGSRWENTKAKEAAAQTRLDLDAADYLILNSNYIQQMVDQLAANAYSELTQPTVVVTGEVPELSVDYDTASANTETVHMTMSITTGTPARNLDSATLVAAIKDAYLSGDFETIVMDYAVVEPETLVAEELYTAYCSAPVNAVENEDKSITHELLGYEFDLAALSAWLETAGYGETYECTFHYVAAEVTEKQIQEEQRKEAAANSANFQDVLGKADTNHTSNSNRNTNLKLACKAINGTVLMPGDTFSFNGVVGKRTEAKGYKPAGAYIGGKTVDTVGGGICQVSSSLYYAALQADLQIVQRTNHGYVVSYLPYGMDATVSWGTLDFKFKNNTDYPIKIQAYVSGGQVHIRLLGTDTRDYTVKLTYETVAGPYEGGTVYETYPSNNKEGYKDGDVIQTAYTGRTVKVYMSKYDKQTGKLLSKTLVNTSTYSKRDKIIAKIEDSGSSSGGSTGSTTATTTAPTTTAPTTETTTAPTTEATTVPTETTTSPPAETTAPTETTEGGSE